MQPGLLLQPAVLPLTYRRHRTDTESGGSGREVELIQDSVGAGWIDDCDAAAEGGTRHEPHRTLAERDGHRMKTTTRRYTGVNYGQRAAWLVMRAEKRRLLCRDGGSGREGR